MPSSAPYSPVRALFIAALIALGLAVSTAGPSGEDGGPAYSARLDTP